MYKFPSSVTRSNSGIVDVANTRLIILISEIKFDMVF